MTMSRVVLCALSLVGQAARFKRGQQQAASVTVQGVKVHNYKENNKEWVVFFKPTAHDSDIQGFCQGKCEFQGHPDKKGLAFAKFHGSEEELEGMLVGQSDVDMIESDEVDYMIPEIESFQTRASASWGLDRIGVSSRATTGKGVHIYVQDTGIRTTHIDFGGRAVGAFDASVSGGQVCGEAACAVDRQGHGSHCAGTAAGTTFGVAPDALLYAVKTLSDQGSGQRSWQYEGIDWVATEGNKPCVLSMSLGGQGKDAGYDAAFESAINAGVVAVVAAGNSNSDTCGFSPAFSKGAITVGATDSNNKRSSFSNFGVCNDIMAPGSAITSAHAADDTNSWTISGTSMACPHVSGAAALLLEADPTLGKDAILKKLKADGLPNYIEGVNANDPIHFLFVGTEGRPDYEPKPPAPPAPACRRRWFC